jgi:HAD superfamily hydrolase (TIGR01509 family)
MLKALIFDVDGTLADTESVHLAAFNQAFAEAGMGWRWSEQQYTGLLDVSGGKERILHYLQQARPAGDALNGLALQATVDRLHALKTAHFDSVVRKGGVHLRPGVLALIRQALDAGLQLAIATTTTRSNIAALLDTTAGPDWECQFAAIGDASVAPVKKPHPQVYLEVLQALALPAHECLAFEDSANGLQAATAAGLATIVTPTRYTRHHDFAAALRVLPDLGSVSLDALTLWHGSSQTRH